MKITNVKVDMFNWTLDRSGDTRNSTTPWKITAASTSAASRQLGVVSVETDEGVVGIAFLVSSRVGADHFVK